MKKIIAVLVLASFALVTTVPADDAKPTDKDAPAEKGGCPAGGEKKGCPMSGEKKGGCPKDAPAPKAPESK